MVSRQTPEEKNQEIRDRQSYRVPTEAHKRKFAEFHAAYMGMLEVILSLPDSRDRAIAITNCEALRRDCNAAIIFTPEESLS